MPLSLQLRGARTDPVVHQVDSRWLMAYAAAVDALAPWAMDTRRPEGIVGHPLFPVCLEWPAVLAVRDLLGDAGLTSAEAARGVHLTHRLQLHRLVRPGDRLRTTATVERLGAHRSGTLVLLALETVDDLGAPVASTDMGTLYRDVDVDDPGAIGAASASATAAAVPVPATPIDEIGFDLVVTEGEAHTYTECARIWNPIHTDARTAERAGLPGIVLHGTATLARALTGLVERAAAGDPRRVRELSCRFGAVVTMPSTLTVHAWREPVDERSPDATEIVDFTVAGPSGEPVLRGGRLLLDRA